MASHTGFRGMSQTLRGCGTLPCRLLVIVRLLRLVVLIFEDVSNFTGCGLHCIYMYCLRLHL